MVFTSANAVDALMQAVVETGGDVRSLKGPMLCAVGSATAEQLARYGIKVDLVPSEYRAEALAGALAAQGSLDEVRVLLPRADIGREVVAESLRAGGALVTEVVAYRNVLDEATDGGPDIYRMLLDRELDVVTFTSASAVRNFAKIYGTEQAVDLLSKTVVAVIGPVTAEAAARLGIPVHVQPTTYTVPALVDAIVRHVTAMKSPGHRGSRMSVAQKTSRLPLSRRPRRLRATEAIRALVRETRLTPDCLIYPLFVCEGHDVRRPIGSMPGIFQLSVDEAVQEAAAATAARHRGRAALRPARAQGRRRLEIVGPRRAGPDRGARDQARRARACWCSPTCACASTPRTDTAASWTASTS